MVSDAVYNIQFIYFRKSQVISISSGSPQVNHGRDVWVLGTAEPDSYDAMVTDRTGVVLAAPGADCMPILFADPTTRVIAVAHAGFCLQLTQVTETGPDYST